MTDSKSLINGGEGGVRKFDWTTIKEDFFQSDYLEVSPFIRAKFNREVCEDSNMAIHTKGWAQDKIDWKKKRAEAIQKKLDDELVKTLKVKLKDLLSNKKLLFNLDSRYLDILNRLDGGGKPLSPFELEFFKNYSDNIKDIWKRIQVELGLPINVEELRGSADKPLVFVDLVRRADKILDEKEKNGRGEDKDKND